MSDPVKLVEHLVSRLIVGPILRPSIFVVAVPAMSSLFAGDRYRSLRHRLGANGQLKRCLVSQQKDYGDLFWYYPIFTGSPVLVVFDPLVAAGILKEESWIFCKALEPWHNRQRSRDPFERLLGDGLLLADGNHHKKRSAQFVRRFENQSHWQALQQRLRRNCEQIVSEKSKFDVNSLVPLLISDVLAVYIGIALDETQVEQLCGALDLAWSSNQKQQACPFRLKKRHASRATRRLIDEARSMLEYQLVEQQKLQPSVSQRPAVSISNKAAVDEILVIAIGLAHKLSTLLTAAIRHLCRLDASIQKQIFAEGNALLDEPTVKSLALGCPLTYQELNHLLADYDSPLVLIKRIAVCDTLIRGVHVPETTEAWIPAWSLEAGFPFGDGRYSCKGEDISLLITARLMQWFCRNSLV